MELSFIRNLFSFRLYLSFEAQSTKKSQTLHINYPPEGLIDPWRLCRLKKIAGEANSYSELKGILVDIGCNDCETTGFLKEDMFEYVGLDISKDALKRGVGRQRILCDACKMPIKDEVANATFCVEVIEHVEDQGVLIAEISRILKTDGKLFISTPNSESLFSKIQKWIHVTRFHNWCFFEYHFQICSPEKLNRLLEIYGFKVLRKARSIAIPPFHATKRKKVFQIASLLSNVVPADLQELLIWTVAKRR